MPALYLNVGSSGHLHVAVAVEVHVHDQVNAHVHQKRRDPVTWIGRPPLLQRAARSV
jgi:hypothetical protein